MEAGQLPFGHKLQLLCTAAASGSDVNLEVALALLQPSIFIELLHGKLRRSSAYSNPGVAAVEAGHPQLLGWLGWGSRLQHGGASWPWCNICCGRGRGSGLSGKCWWLRGAPGVAGGWWLVAGGWWLVEHAWRALSPVCLPTCQQQHVATWAR